jgi:hypothetical protein
MEAPSIFRQRHGVLTEFCEQQGTDEDLLLESNVFSTYQIYSPVDCNSGVMRYPSYERVVVAVSLLRIVRA